ncbi:MAG: FtsQ-type POTRA domain-containing protein [Micropruina sp.]|nr:FtsQ-type POTRA domain-containing protein [Micropruina sp.]
MTTRQSTVRDATPQFAQRRRFSRGRRLIIASVAAAALLLGGGLFWLVAGSSALAVRTVTVTGAKVLDPQQVREIAAVPLGQPLIWVDPGLVAQRVSGLAPVARVRVARTWPDAITIDVTERRGQFVLAVASGYQIVDASGVIFQSVQERPKGLTLAKVPSGDARVLANLASVLEALPPDLHKQLASVAANTPDTIVLDLDDGTELVWGSVEQTPLKVQIVTALMKSVSARVYDVSSPSHPTTR